MSNSNSHSVLRVTILAAALFGAYGSVSAATLHCHGVDACDPAPVVDQAYSAENEFASGQPKAWAVIGTDGAVVNTKGATVTGTGNNARGVVAQTGAKVSMEGGSITTDGASATGVQSYTEGSVANLKDTTVRTQSEQYAVGVLAQQKGVVNGQQVNVHTKGTFSSALEADRGGEIHMVGGEISTQGYGAAGARAISGSGSVDRGVITLDGVKITSNNGIGLIAGDEDGGGGPTTAGDITLINGTVLATGINVDPVTHGPVAQQGVGAAARVQHGSSLTIKESTLTSSQHDGITARNAGSTVSVEDSTIIANGNGQAGGTPSGIYAEDSASVTIVRGTITATGTSFTNGILAETGATIQADGTQISTSGANSAAVIARQGGKINLLGGAKVQATGADSNALAMTEGSQQRNIVHIDGASLTTTHASSDAIRIQDSGDLTLNNTLVQTQGVAIKSSFTQAGQTQAIIVGSGSDLKVNNGNLLSVTRTVDGQDGQASLTLQAGSVSWGNVGNYDEDGKLVDVDALLTKLNVEDGAVWAGIELTTDTQLTERGQTANITDPVAAQIAAGDGSTVNFANGATIARNVVAGSGASVNFNGTTSIGENVNAMPGASMAFNGDTTIAGNVTAINGAQMGFNGQTSHIGGSVVMAGAGTQIRGGAQAPITIGGDVSASDGATVGGNLNVTGALRGTGGILRPGNSIGSQSFGTSADFTGDYHVEVNKAGASDLITITAGDFDLRGINLFVDEENGNGGYLVAHDYTIVKTGKADGISAVASNEFANKGELVGALAGSLVKLDPVIYGDNDVKIRLSVDSAKVAQASASLTGNQRATLGGVLSVAGLNASADAALTSADYGNVLNQLSGEIHATTQSALIQSGSMLSNTIAQRVHNGHTTGKKATGTPMWAQVVGGWSTLDGKDGSAEAKSSIAGLMLGGDVAVGAGWRVGGALGFTNSNIDVDARNSKADVTSYSATVYGANSWAAGKGKVNFLAGAGYSRHDIETSRNVSVAGGQTLKADYKANTAQLFTELGYAFPVGAATTVEPYIGVDWMNLRSKGFSETGGSAALVGQSQKDSVTSITAGIRGTTQLELAGRELQLNAGVGVRKASGDVNPTRSMAFAQGNGANFSVAGAPVAKTAALVTVGAQMALSKNSTVGVSYGGQYGSGIKEHSGMVNLKIRF